MYGFKYFLGGVSEMIGRNGVTEAEDYDREQQQQDPELHLALCEFIKEHGVIGSLNGDVEDLKAFKDSLNCHW
jgi:hypothetical protein